MKPYKTIQTQRISMSEEEYLRMPQKFGWKYDYYDGETHIQPQEWAVYAAAPVRLREVQSPLALRPARLEDEPELKTVFLECFHDSVEYCDWSEEKFAGSAQRCVGGWYTGRRGQRLDVSRVAVTPATPQEPGRIVGAALVVRDAIGPFLDLLYVLPAWQRQGLATALMSDVMNALYAQGETTLYSSYHPANEASVTWHTRFGFVDEPDFMLTQSHLDHARFALERREELGDLEPEERVILERECELWTARWEELAARMDIEGRAAVSPILRHHAGRSYY